MKSITIIALSLLLIVAAGTLSCKHKSFASPADGNFPEEVGKILVGKCAISGCHNAASFKNANGLLLDSWEHLLQGGNSGTSIVAYSPKFSPLLYFVNTDTANGEIVATPTMPLSTSVNPQAPLTKAEYKILHDWIAAGAPDKNGNIPFASDASTRQKIYITMQSCDQMAVIDGGSKLVMRYLAIGADSTRIEGPHCVRFSHDGVYAYTVYIGGDYIQKIDATTDAIAGSVNVGSLVPGGTGGQWNILHLPEGDSTLIASDLESNGIVATVNTNSMQVKPKTVISGSGVLVNPHGIATTIKGDTAFVTGQYGNVVYRIAYGTPVKIKSIPIRGTDAITTEPVGQTMPNPHDIIMSPDYSQLFVTCQKTNEIRVIDPHTYAILDSINVGVFPQEMAVCTLPGKPYLFVTCTEDADNSKPNCRGSVYVINYNTHEIVKKIYGDFFQPHGLAVDNRYGRLYVASTNANPGGPVPHHSTYCGGNAGWYSVYDIGTLEPSDGKRYEVTVKPYSADVRFK